MEIVFFGTPQFAATSLNALIENPSINVKAVVTQVDKKIGRGQKIGKSPVKMLAEEKNIPIFQPQNKQELAEICSKMTADFFVVIAFGMIFDKASLEMPKICPINVHASLLPKYRGASPIQSSLLHGDKESGVSIMQMSEKLDNGPVFQVFKIDIDAQDDFFSLNAKLEKLSAENLAETLHHIAEKKVEATAQDDSKATYCSKIEKSSGEIFWNKSAQDIINQVRAYKLWPGSFFKLKDKKIKVLELRPTMNAQDSSPGTFRVQDSQLFVACKDREIEILSLHMEGKSPCSAKDFLNGYRQLLS